MHSLPQVEFELWGLCEQCWYVYFTECLFKFVHNLRRVAFRACNECAVGFAMHLENCLLGCYASVLADAR